MSEMGTCRQCDEEIPTGLDECPECGFDPNDSEVLKFGAATLLVSFIVGALVSQVIAAIVALAALVIIGLSFVPSDPTD